MTPNTAGVNRVKEISMLRRGFVFLTLVVSLAFVSCEQPANGDPATGVVNAQTPSITGQPQGGTWDVSEDDEFTLTVTANSPDSGTLAYQWYSNTTNAAIGGTPIGTDNAALTLQKTDYPYNQDYYFYVVVTNTISDNGDGGNKTATATSNAAKVTVTGNLVNAQPPSITTQPQDGTWDVTTADTFSLTITASSPDSEIPLGYQWYSNSSASNSGGTAMPGETNAGLTLAKANYTGDGPRYFYVVVTNTINDNNDGGQKTATAASNAVTVTVTGNGVAAVNAQQPVINTQPQGRTWDVFAVDTLNLTVGASVTDGGTLSYQWYATIGPAVLSRNNPVTPGGTDATLSLNRENYTTDGASSYFFVDVKNTNTNVTGNQTTTAASAIVTVAITGNVEFTYVTTPLPQDLIGEWIKQETITISANEFSSQVPGWSDYDYGGTIAGHRSNGDGAGYITIQYTQHHNTGAIGKYYVIHYKELTSASMKYSAAFKTSDPGFANEGGGGKATQEEAERMYTLTGGYYTSTFDDNAYTLVVKAGA